MNKFKFLMLLGAALFCLLPLKAKKAYGFLTGSNDQSIGVGIYCFNAENGQDLKSEYLAMFGLWGGAGDGKNYYCLLSYDYDGLQMAGMAVYDVENQEFKIKFPNATYGCTDMTYDHTTATMYGVVCQINGGKLENYLATIDLKTGNHTKVAGLKDKIKAIACNYQGQLYGMSSASDLYLIDKNNGELTLMGNNGETTASEQVQSLEFDHDTGRLYWYAIDSYYNCFYAEVNPETGKLISYNSTPDNVLLGGIYIPFTNPSTGPENPVEKLHAVSSFTATRNGENIVLNWESINQEGTTYQITRHPDEYTVKGITGTTYTDKEITEPGYYFYTIYAYNEKSTSHECMSNEAVGGPDLIPSFAFDLKTTAGMKQWKMIDQNQDNNTWKIQGNGLSYLCSFKNAADDWAISLPIKFRAGQTYQLKYNVESGLKLLGNAEDYRITLGTDATIESQKQVIHEMTNYISEGVEHHQIEFTVEKDGYYTLGIQAFSKADQFLILFHDIEIDLAVNSDLKAEQLTGDFITNIHTPYVCRMAFTNNGKTDIQGYKVKIVDHNNLLLATQEVSSNMVVGQTDTLDFEIVYPEAGMATLYGIVEASIDDNPDNNRTPGMIIDVRPENEKIVRIGQNNASPILLPFSFEGDYYNYTQSIYTPEEIDVAKGYIKDVYYFYNNQSGSTLSNLNVQVYMNNTVQKSPAEGWINMRFLTSVFNENISMKPGENALHYHLKEPFLYEGDHLCIMNSKLRDGTQANVRFRATQHENQVRTVIITNDNGTIDLKTASGSTMINDIYLVIDTSVADGIEDTSTDMAAQLTPYGNNRFGISDKVEQVEIINMEGRLCLRMNTNGQSVIDLNSLPKGIYLARTLGCNKSFGVQKIIIQ